MKNTEGVTTLFREEFLRMAGGALNWKQSLKSKNRRGQSSKRTHYTAAIAKANLSS